MTLGMLRPAHPLISCCYTTFGRRFAADGTSNNLNNINGLGFYHEIRGNLHFLSVNTPSDLINTDDACDGYHDHTVTNKTRR